MEDDLTPSPVIISKLLPVDVRTAWAGEAANFTPWLLDNSEFLSDILGVQVELQQREYKVGPFSLDLYGSIAGAEDQIVIVENQYGETDHRHLGQILTYAGGTDPAIIIWIAERFREEHRAALDWLNHHTPPEIRFFGIQLGVVRMAGGPAGVVAPRFELVSSPNDWEKIAKLEVAVSQSSGPAPSPAARLYKEFWELFGDEAVKRNWTNGTPPAANWWSLPSGTSAINWTVSYTMFGCRSELNFGHPDPLVNTFRLDVLRQREAEIRAAFGADGHDLDFDFIEGKKSTRLDHRLNGPKVADKTGWSEVISWMLDSQERLRSAIAVTGGIPTDLPTPGYEGPDGLTDSVDG